MAGRLLIRLRFRENKQNFNSTQYEKPHNLIRPLALLVVYATHPIRHQTPENSGV